MKDKNMILLIGIILIWLFIIRPKTKNTETAEPVKTTDTVEAFDEIKEGASTVKDSANVSGYVTSSEKANKKTVSETQTVDNFPIRSYTS